MFLYIIQYAGDKLDDNSTDKLEDDDDNFLE